MAWPTTRSYKDAASVTRTAVVDQTATSGEDVPIYKPSFGANGADPTVVALTAGLPVQPTRVAGGWTTYAKVAPSAAAVTGNGNVAAVGGTGGSAVPGVFIVQALDSNSTLVTLGDSNTSAFTGEVRGYQLGPGDSAPIISTEDLRSLKVSARTLGDGVVVVKVG